MMLLGSMFAMALALALSALASRARADCDACVAGQCHSRRPILAGFPVTGQMTIDRSLNVLYLQLNSNQNVAIFLDDLQHRLINMMSTRGMDVDQSSHTLYMGTEDGPFYRYDLDSNTTVGVPQLNKGLRSNIIKYLRHDKLVYIEDYANNTSVFHFVSTSVFDVDYTLSVNYPVKDFVLDDRNIYFVSNNTLYVCGQIYTGSYPPQPPKEIISKKHMSISSSYFENNYKNDWIYIGSASEKLIYKLNKSTQELIIHAGYKSGTVQDFVMGKDDVIVFREMDGSVAQWVPSDRRCVVEPPHGDFFVRETTCL
ncbi:uncharacterized protein LOC125227295 [Leguminivora glycinivorella]|uniref:uncharacterized protein LOC125227295 n=1 Tax=Leguminivora glycinivorella TaxID=1035111 RepID=UPI00200DF1BC|nr:uncharacterized protein LOC125227295 [Leguminivora glycinivorella]